MAAPPDYDPRYLAGICFFNEHAFFEAHEVWEDLWGECPGPERRFYQGLIQAAVALFHFGNGNLRGAAKLFASARDKMTPYGSPYLGLDTAKFWTEMDRCFSGVREGDPDCRLPRPDALIPTLSLDPPPAAWPDPDSFLPEHN